MSDTDTQQGFFSRLRLGLRKTSQAIGQQLSDVITRRTLDDAMLEACEEALLAADVGVATTLQVVETLRQEKFASEVSEDEVRRFLADKLASRLAAYARPLHISAEHRPFVMVMVGVNGNGKTTTLGKLAKRFSDDGLKVVLGAADTFRAAAVEQLEVWADRAGAPLVKGVESADPASVAYQAVEQAMATGADLVMIDTAGRLHTKDQLMDELAKIVRVIRKLDPSAPHAVVQVIDATTGQNALKQIEVFKGVAGVSGLIVSKLDGSAKAGVVIAACEQFALPVHAIGVGEQIEDLQDFNAQAFAAALMGLEPYDSANDE